MAYPNLQQKIWALHKKYHINKSELAAKLKVDKSTVGRWMNNISGLPQGKQSDIVNAICELLKPTATQSIHESYFTQNSFLAFCQRCGMTKFEAAVFGGYNLPIPDIIIDSVFDTSIAADNYLGKYILYRHDKDRDPNGRSPPYLQAYAEIANDPHGQLVYGDQWGQGGDSEQYVGNVFLVGSVVNIIGQSKTQNSTGRPEIWWCGLRFDTAVNGFGKTISYFHGYVSDITRDGRLYSDRLLLVRSAESPDANLSWDQYWTSQKDSRRYYANRSELVGLCGEDQARYLDEWAALSI